MSFAEVNLPVETRAKNPCKRSYSPVSGNLILDRYMWENCLKFDGLLHFPLKITYCCILWKGDFLNVNIMRLPSPEVLSQKHTNLVALFVMLSNLLLLVGLCKLLFQLSYNNFLRTEGVFLVFAYKPFVH